MRSSMLIAALALLCTHYHAIASADGDEGGLFISRVDRTQGNAAQDLITVNPFDAAQDNNLLRHSKALKQYHGYVNNNDDPSSWGKGKSSKMTYVGKLYFGNGKSGKSEKVPAEVVLAPITTVTRSSRPTLRPSSKPTALHLLQPVFNNKYQYNTKTEKGSKSEKSGKSGSKSAKHAYITNTQFVRPLPLPTTPPVVQSTTTTTTTTSTTSTSSTTTQIATTTTAAITTAIETTTTTEETTTSSSATDSFKTGGTSSPPSYQCFSERNELLAAVDRYTTGGCGAEEAKEYYICKGDVAKYGWPIGSWCLGEGVTSLSRIFFNRDEFNEDISGWRVGNVTDMWGMFIGAKSFNQDLSTWNVSSVTGMQSMFSGASSFNQDLCEWSDKFPYDDANDIFVNTNCTYPNVPDVDLGGPFCASSCGAEITTSTDATVISTTTSTVPEVSSTTTLTETTSTTLPETTTTTDVVLNTEAPSASPSIQSSTEPSSQPTASPSVKPTIVSVSTTSSSISASSTTSSTTTTSDASITSMTSSTMQETTTSSTANITSTTTGATVVSTTTTSPDLIGSTTTSVSIGGSTTAASQEPLRISLSYDISNQCGLDSEKVMNEVENTLKVGLIAATTTILQQTLAEEITRSVDNATETRIIPGIRGSSSAVTPQRYKMNLPGKRALATYTDEYPVTIDRILDVEQGCDPGTNCLLIISTISVMLEEGDDPDEVKNTVTEAILASFDDGRFNDAVPDDTIVCPMEEMSSIMLRAHIP